MNWSSFLFGAASSLLASFIFLFSILVFLRPSIKIGKFIMLDKDDDDKPCYRLKFYNTSIFSAYDVVVDLTSLEDRSAEPKGKDIYPKPVSLTKSHFNFIPHWLPMICVRTYAHHCIQVRTYDNLSEILSNPHKSLQLRITLRHGLTGLSKNFIKNYQTDAIIRKGSFEFGNSFEPVKIEV